MTARAGQAWVSNQRKAFHDSLSGKGLFRQEDWLFPTPHAVDHYPCREISKVLLYRLFQGDPRVTFVIEEGTSSKYPNALMFITTDPSDGVPPGRQGLEILIDFSPSQISKVPWRGVVISVFREGSPKECCWAAAGAKPLCSAAKKAARRL